MKNHWTIRCCVTGLMLVICSQVASANQVTWTIDASQSKLTLAIPDQTLNLNGTTAVLRMRNQSGTSNTWNQGNSAGLSGTFLSEYKELSGGPSLEFTAGGALVGVNSGSYRPNPAAFSPFPSSDTGTYLNNSTAPAVFGSKGRSVVSLVSLDLGYFSFHNVVFDLAGLAALTGSNGNYSYAASQAALGLANADVAIQGLPAIVVDHLLPNTIDTISVAATSLSSGSATIASTGGLNRRMTIPILVSSVMDLSGTPLLFTFSGQIVATAVVPEPSGIVLAGLGLLCLAFQARQRSARSRYAEINLPLV